MDKQPEIVITVNQADEKPKKQVIKPVSVEKKLLTEAQKEIEPPPGHALVFAVDSEGNAIQGKWWFYPLRNVDKIYGDKSKYLIKKKDNQ